MKITKILITLSLFVSSNDLFAYNVKNTGVLYRVDTRNDTEIFANGFSPFGDNRSIIDHSRGVSCINRDENSAFVSVSADPEYAGNYARRLIALGHENVYVYIINSRNDFYNMANSLVANDYTTGVNDAMIQSEWISDGPISASSIRGVRRYTTHITPPITPNQNYIQETPVINNNVIYSREHMPGIIPYIANLIPLAGACMAATISCFKPTSQKESGDSCYFIESYKNETVLLYSTFIVSK